MARPPAPPPRSARLVALYALANAGGVVAYLPLLSLLLPLRIAEVAPAARIDWFTLAAILGAVVASIANIAAGWASDRSVARGGGRRGWVIAGLVALLPAYAAVALATTPALLVAAVVGVQLAVNLLLAPLLAMMADEIDDAHKGVATGLLALGAPLAAAFAALLLTLSNDADVALALVPLAVIVCVLPLALARPAMAAPIAAASSRRATRRDLAIAWTARLLVQVAGTVLSLYLVFYFQSIAPPGGDARRGAASVGSLMALASVLALPAAVAFGRLSDRTGRRLAVLCGAAIMAATGLLVMAFARGWVLGAAGYALYAVGSGVFLALHSGVAMLLLPDPAHRGRDLGIVNLANTAPALIGPALTWALATTQDFSRALVALAALTAAGGVTMLAVRGRGSD
ncbi:MFS transporter [Sphingomonas baiyangensis]|uniref:MFS transporter n=1 Tax=Sphingomonas baiyangensis TaxID=2572576 RepID=A0A4U1L771_9SPHN|nr:MFS transporter [Sphingomonas baiyangensis]TKD52797.1 MFS transporter [Sphingomonas baiyangensis]